MDWQFHDIQESKAKSKLSLSQAKLNVSSHVTTVNLAELESAISQDASMGSLIQFSTICCTKCEEVAPFVSRMAEELLQVPTVCIGSLDRMLNQQLIGSERKYRRCRYD